MVLTQEINLFGKRCQLNGHFASALVANLSTVEEPTTQKGSPAYIRAKSAWYRG
jgi:hypothetical protein